MIKKLRIAIVSDLHCLHSSSEVNENTTSSFLHTDKMRSPVTRHPVSSLISKIDEDLLRADILICPGDITHRIDKQGLITGLGFLEEIKNALRANEMIISTGNHDIDTYRLHKDAADALDVTKNFTEYYPYKESNLNKEYWVDGYCLTQYENINILNINSCHNLMSPEDAETVIIKTERIDAIKRKIGSLEINKSDFNIVVLHHHPIKHSNTDEIIYRDKDVLSNGEILIKDLRAFGFDLIIHGHKHRARITEQDNSSIFCSGSFSCTMNVTEHSYTNFFHIMEISKKNGRTGGKILSWDYSSDNGWAKSSDYKKFPCKTGFGNIHPVEELVEQILEFFNNKKLVMFDEVITKYPHFDHLKLETQLELIKILETQHSIIFRPEIYDSAEKIIKHD